ncbi:uncharacterized protein DUF993 [Thermosporothrix hazakensis]|jgi:hypothetical protein|uniref:Uncharacterized protein DUF993 n=1 Tax=Thermosporothrix hazakensis TaxID=644383 RepID=A0A326UBM4_THEHA|nr:dihydrodipicolinate synthase family protein [Thermosporothrix hazakensis]PZW22466.1 uncharacterized protein DUF993 [Thermosporothrix hazakensis]GCE45523.1 hypothetical protein KTH_03920 [Thermosporothrix hazakensis]
MSQQIRLPQADGTLEPYTLKGPFTPPVEFLPPKSRKAFAAAHVVCDPLAENGPAQPATLDWDATMSYRRYLWSLGFSVAEAMDTAQRGMGLDWHATKELIRRSLTEARTYSGGIACGAGTDQLAPSPSVTLDDVIAAYEEQCEFIEGEGGRIILMASRALAACARTPDEYLHVYERILSQVRQPVILHWLGDIFDPALHGYWGSTDLNAAMDVCLDVIRRHTSKIDGIKISLLDAEREITMRRLLPEGVHMYTGDDFNYPRLILGDEQGYSDALLGIFDAIAPVASAALQALDQGDIAHYQALLEPTVPLSRHIFQAPTYYYKTGVVFMAYLNGHQKHFHMVGGLENARSILHLVELFKLADTAGLLLQPELALTRMRTVLALAGIEETGA